VICNKGLRGVKGKGRSEAKRMTKVAAAAEEAEGLVAAALREEPRERRWEEFREPKKWQPKGYRMERGRSGQRKIERNSHLRWYRW